MPDQKSIRNIVKVLLRATVSLSLLVFLLFSVDLGDFAEALSRVRWTTITYCFVLISFGVFISAYKWQAFLLLHEIHFSLYRVTQLHLVGIFFNNLLPTSVGGDLVKASLLVQRGQPLPDVVSSIFAERFSGPIAVTCYSVAGLILIPDLLPGVGGSAALLPCLVLIAAMILLYLARLRIKQLLPEKISKVYDFFVSSFRLYAGNRHVLLRATWTSYLFQLLIGAVYFLVAKKLAMAVGFGPLLAIVSMVSLLTLLPISLNGIGLREGGFVYSLGQLGVPSHEALVLSLIAYAIVLFFSLLGWAAFVNWRHE